MAHFDITDFFPDAIASLEGHKFPGFLLAFLVFYTLFRMFAWIKDIHKFREVRSIFILSSKIPDHVLCVVVL